MIMPISFSPFQSFSFFSNPFNLFRSYLKKNTQSDFLSTEQSFDQQILFYHVFWGFQYFPARIGRKSKNVSKNSSYIFFSLPSERQQRTVIVVWAPWYVLLMTHFGRIPACHQHVLMYATTRYL